MNPPATSSFSGQNKLFIMIYVLAQRRLINQETLNKCSYK